jgi:hypothetical protein
MVTGVLSDASGGAVGAGIGLLIAGPGGLFAGAVVGPVVAKLFRELGDESNRRLLGPREMHRIGEAAATAQREIERGLDEGRQIRSDGFFDADSKGRSSGAEILEGVFQKAQQSYEERKVELLGVLYSEIVFRPEISPAHAHHLLSLLGALTYRQVAFLSVVAETTTRDLLPAKDFRGSPNAEGEMTNDGVALLTEIYDLYQRGVLADARSQPWLSVGDVAPAHVRPQGSGDLLSVLLALPRRIPDSDKGAVSSLLEQLR